MSPKVQEIAADARELLDEWFGEAIRDADEAQRRMPIWFTPDVARDSELERFEPLVRLALAGKLQDWRRHPRSCLALILLLDQFPRQLYRGSPDAFAGDGRALALARLAVQRGFLSRLHPLEASFLAMPFQHAEDLSAQREGVRHYRRLLSSAPPDWRKLLESSLAYSEKHLAIVETFGRFPYRSAILGRPMTAAEKAYIEEGGDSFGQIPPRWGRTDF